MSSTEQKEHFARIKSLMLNSTDFYSVRISPNTSEMTSISVCTIASRTPIYLCFDLYNCFILCFASLIFCWYLGWMSSKIFSIALRIEYLLFSSLILCPNLKLNPCLLQIYYTNFLNLNSSSVERPTFLTTYSCK